MSTAQPIYSVVLLTFSNGVISRSIGNDVEAACDCAIDWFHARDDVREACVISSIEGVVAHYGKDGDNAPFAEVTVPEPTIRSINEIPF